MSTFYYNLSYTSKKLYILSLTDNLMIWTSCLCVWQLYIMLYYIIPFAAVDLRCKCNTWSLRWLQCNSQFLWLSPLCVRRYHRHVIRKRKLRNDQREIIYKKIKAILVKTWHWNWRKCFGFRPYTWIQYRKRKCRQ